MALRSPVLLPVLFSSSVAAVAAAGEARFMATPDIRGDRVVFNWEGDLQLEKAVEAALWRVQEQPWQFPPVPAYPRK
jgi:hypothetical protein